MKNLRLSAFWLCCVCVPAWSQGDAGLAIDASAAERARVDSIRQQRTAELDAEEAACTFKFAVTDCQSKVTVRRRQMLADLKRQETSLNAAQRQQKGQDQQQRADEKAKDSTQREAEARATAEKALAEDREKAQDDKVRAHLQKANPAGSKASTSKSTSTLDPKDIAKNREAYQEKQKALEKRRQKRDQRLKDHPSTNPPLPVAP